MSYVKTIIRAIQQWVADKLTEQSEEIRKAIPTDTVSSEQLTEAMEEMKKDIPEGFSGEWDDLEGKPFGEEVSKLFDETISGGEWIETDSQYYANLNSVELTEAALNFVDGEIYTVFIGEQKFDNVIAKISELSVTLGATLPTLGTAGEEYPFFIAIRFDDDTTVRISKSFEMSAGESLRVVILENRIIPLDPKFLPEMPLYFTIVYTKDDDEIGEYEYELRGTTYEELKEAIQAGTRVILGQNVGKSYELSSYIYYPTGRIRIGSSYDSYIELYPDGTFKDPFRA